VIYDEEKIFSRLLYEKKDLIRDCIEEKYFENSRAKKFFFSLPNAHFHTVNRTCSKFVHTQLK